MEPGRLDVGIDDTDSMPFSNQEGGQIGQDV
jgi:hypothetical protein